MKSGGPSRTLKELLPIWEELEPERYSRGYVMYDGMMRALGAAPDLDKWLILAAVIESLEDKIWFYKLDYDGISNCAFIHVPPANHDWPEEIKIFSYNGNYAEPLLDIYLQVLAHAKEQGYKIFSWKAIKEGAK